MEEGGEGDARAGEGDCKLLQISAFFWLNVRGPRSVPRCDVGGVRRTKSFEDVEEMYRAVFSSSWRSSRLEWFR